MQALHRTRSQHFVSSPRKAATPLKRKIARHSSKRRRLGSNSTTFAPLASNPASSSDEQEGKDLPDLPGPSRTRQRREALSSEAGQQAVNRTGSRSRRKDNGKDKVDWKEGIPDDVFTSDDPMSPKKRKRGDKDGDACSETTSSSWIEMDEDEEEPEFIAESDQHLLHDAPAHTLHRLRKAELIRLWKVAGMWSEDDDGESEAATAEEDDDGGLSKKELVDGLIAARRQSFDRRMSSDDAPRPSSHANTSNANPDHVIKRLRSASSSIPVSTASSSSSGGERTTGDLEATPRAAPRTRSRVKKPEASLLRSVYRRPNGGKATRGRDGVFRSRSKSHGAEERKARFGDNVKSPGKDLTKRRTRRSSTQSSAYTTTDTSPPANPPPTRQVPRRKSSRHTTPATRRRSRSRVGFKDANDFEVIEIDSTDDESNKSAAPTPLAERLRPRGRNSFIKDPSSELEADGEDEPEIDPSGASPIRTRRSSRSGSNLKSERPVRSQSRRNSRLLPDRGAKTKAIEALKGGESEDEPMDVDPDVVEDDIGDSPRSGPLTRSQLKQQQEEGMESDGADVSEDNAADASRGRVSNSLTPAPSTDDDMDAEEEPEVATEANKVGSVRDKKRHTPHKDSNGDHDETDDDADDAFKADVDLADATLSSLLRLLRDELVQMCESRGLEVGGTKPQLAQALLDWRDEQNVSDHKSTTSSQATARPSSSRSKKIIHAIGSNKHVSGKTTPVLLRDHIHATDPATPPRSDDSKRVGEAELNLDLSELGLEDSIIKPSQLQKLEKIGSGGFKDVYVGKLRGRKVAISEFREQLSEMDIRELKLLAEFSHPNIVKFRGICIPEDNSQVPCMLVSELCENGDLFDYIRNVPCPPLKRVLGLMLDIARGLEYLHTRKPAIIHRDCKSSNILINRAGQAKVGDFGLARVKHSTRSMIRSLVGTVNWQAPELWHPSPRYDYKVDVFSAAVVYWEMMSGWIGEKKYPWEGHNEHYIYDAVGNKQRRPSVAGLRKHWGAEPVNLMERMWHQDPGERPTMTDVVVDLEVLIAECE